MRYLLLSFFVLILLSSLTYATPYPVIFVHGIGDSSVAWKETGPKISEYYEKYYLPFKSGSGIGEDRFDQDFKDNLRNSCVYVTFSDHFASPIKLVPELKKVIDDTIAEAKVDKVNLVCHSMGGLVARQYLVEYPKEHNVNKLITIASANLGATGLLFNWGPTALVVTGIGGTILSANPLPLGLTIIGLGWDMISQARGVKLLSGAVESMKPGSEFLKMLNSKNMPTDVEYMCIISDTTHFPHTVGNVIMGHEGGDGAVSVKSQRLSKESVPNFEELKYSESYIDLPHYEEPNAVEAISEALGI